jgi:WD40 repeat protein
MQRIAFTPDGKILATLWSRSEPFQLWETASGKLRFELRGQKTVPYGLALSPDGSVLAAPSFDGVRLWSVASGKPLGLLDYHADDPKRDFPADQTVAFSPDGRTLFAGSNGLENNIRIWDWKAGVEVGWITSGHVLHYLTLSPDGKLLASCGGPTVHVWEVATRTRVVELKSHKGPIPCVAFSPDGRLLAAADVREKAVWLWDVVAGKEVAPLEGHTDAVYVVAFAPDGRTQASGGADGTTLLWDLRGLESRLPATSPTDKERDALWAALRAEKGADAYRAMRSLAGAGDQAVALLKVHLKAVPELDAKRVQRLIADLNASKGAVREAAAKELAGMGERVEPALRQALAARPSAEVRRALEALLGEMKTPWVGSADVREVRAVQVLEWVGSAAARDLLKTLSQGAANASLTRDAKGALERLHRYRAGR